MTTEQAAENDGWGLCTVQHGDKPPFSYYEKDGCVKPACGAMTGTELMNCIFGTLEDLRHED